jgi:hypothetical protein
MLTIEPTGGVIKGNLLLCGYEMLGVDHLQVIPTFRPVTAII